MSIKIVKRCVKCSIEKNIAEFGFAHNGIQFTTINICKTCNLKPETFKIGFILCEGCGSYKDPKEIIYRRHGNPRVKTPFCFKCGNVKPVSDTATRVCIFCKQEKLLKENFGRSNVDDAYFSTCNVCKQAKERIRRQNLRADHSNVYTFDVRYCEYRSRARVAGLSNTLTKEQFLLFWQKPCTYCGVVIETIGLDRVDNNKGYEFGNVIPCCQHCNTMKSNLSLQEFVEKCRIIVERTKNVQINVEADSV